MTAFLVAGPAAEPVSLAEAKTYLRLDDALEDGLVRTLVTAARMHVESVTDKALLEQTWRFVRDDWPDDGRLRLPVAPFARLVSVYLSGPDGEQRPVSLGFAIEGDRLRLSGALPRPDAGRGGIEITYVAGFGAGPEDVPADLRQAMLILVAHWYAHRDAVLVAGSGALVPVGFDACLGQHRRVGL